MTLDYLTPGAMAFVVCLFTAGLTEFLNNMVATSMTLPILSQLVSLGFFILSVFYWVRLWNKGYQIQVNLGREESRDGKNGRLKQVYTSGADYPILHRAGQRRRLVQLGLKFYLTSM